MSNVKHDIRESSPVEELIGNPPSSMVRWGISAIAIVFILSLVASWMISYPYIISGKITLTTSNPPASMMAQLSGQITKLYVTEGQLVRNDEHLALIETSADLESVLWLSDILENKPETSISLVDENTSIYVPGDPDLGELRTNYSSYRTSLDNYLNHIAVDYYGKKISAVLAEIEGIDEYIKQLERKESLYADKLELVEAEYDRLSILYSDTLVAQQEIEDAQRERVDEMLQLEQIRLDKQARIIEKASRLQDLEDFKASREEEKRKLFVQVENERLNLKGELDIWYRKHLLRSPIDGTVTFSRFWGNNQAVEEGDIVMTIVPEGESRIIGRLELSMRRSGEVEVDQKVLIKLSGYPFIEKGILEGRVESVSKVATDDLYIVDVSLPSELITNYGEEVQFAQNMSGTGEIVTQNVRLIERVIYPVRSILERNKVLKSN